MSRSGFDAVSQCGTTVPAAPRVLPARAAGVSGEPCGKSGSETRRPGGLPPRPARAGLDRIGSLRADAGLGAVALVSTVGRQRVSGS